MRTLIGFGLCALAIGQFVYFGYNIFTLLLLIILGFCAGLLSHNKPITGNTSADNLSTLAFLERTKYLRNKD